MNDLSVVEYPITLYSFLQTTRKIVPKEYLCFGVKDIMVMIILITQTL